MTQRQQQYRTRSQRFAVDVPLRYRPAGDAVWQSGRIANISGTGVLFRADRPLTLNTKVELTFALNLLAPEAPPSSGPTVICLGQIVRTEPSTSPDFTLAIAAAIHTYRFVRPATSPAGPLADS